MKQVNWRNVTLAIFGSAVVSMSSIYTALRMGALPWPTIFSALVAFFVLRKFSNLNEINVAHTGMSAGGLVAGGMAFTVPAIWMLGGDVSFSRVVLFTLLGVLFGTGLVLFMRNRYVPELTFPMGIAAAQTLRAGDEGGRKAKILFSWMGVSGAFTLFRDGFGLIPVVWKGVGLFPMAVGIGFIIGTLYTLSWFLGGVTSSILSHFVSTEVLKRFGVGLLVGGGVGLAFRGFKLSGFRSGGKFELLVLVVVFVFGIVLGLGFFESLLFTLLGYVAVSMAGVVTGTTGIDPMEVFAMIVVVVLRAFVEINAVEATLIALSIAVAAGLSGDALQDMKAGYMLRTDPVSQLVSEIVGAVVGVFIATLSLFAIKNAYGSFGPGTQFPSPQAFAVSQVVSGGLVSLPFIMGLSMGVFLQIFGVPALTFGIGMYLPLFITLPVAIGGFLRFVFDVKFKDKVEDGIVASSGVMGGEGVVGVLVGIFLAFKG